MAKNKRRKSKKKNNQRSHSNYMKDKMITGYVKNNYADFIEEYSGVTLYSWQKKLINIIARVGK